MNPFEETQPSLYIADVTIEFQVWRTKDSIMKSWQESKKRKTITHVESKTPLLMMNGEIYPEKAKKKFLERVGNKISFKPIEGTLKIKSINNIKFSSKINYRV